MVQIKKTEIEMRILTAAQEVFWAKDFRQASLREIADKANISKSNLYNYFKDKNTIFEAVLEPIITKINEAIKYMEEYSFSQIGQEISLDVTEQLIATACLYIDQNRQLFELLMFKASGSSLEKFVDQVTDQYTLICIKYFQIVKKNHPQLRTDFSHFLIHNCCNLYINSFAELLMHKIPLKKMKKHILEIYRLTSLGWVGLMKEEPVLNNFKTLFDKNNS